MFTKWKINIDRFKNYRFAENKTLWKLSFIDANGKQRAAKQIKKQTKNRYILNGEPWSESQLRPHLELDCEPIELVKNIEMPF